jgi:hypothetical protein
MRDRKSAAHASTTRATRAHPSNECALCLTEFHSTDSPIKTEIDGKTVEIHDFDCTKEKANG